jgi:predicted DNA-binding ribbon-helix-helix protein
MNNPIELLKKTEALLFSLDPSQALELKAKTFTLLKKLAEKDYPFYTRLIHQITQRRKIQENFLAWLACECLCAECEN